MAVLQGRRPERRPIWFMRQAGRYLPEYREIRGKVGSFLDLCYNPEMACEVTLQPLRRYDLDAAILFADILVVPHAMGVDLKFVEGEGPVLEKVWGREDVGRLSGVLASDYVKSVCETVGLVRTGLNGRVPLIGFCGGPWTVASYMVEGGSSDRLTAKKLALEGVDWFGELIERLIVESVEYLGAQIVAGAQAVQIFDSWAGELCGSVRLRYVVEPLEKMCAMLRQRFPEVPVIVFARGVGADHGVVAKRTGANAVGVESEARLSGVLSGVPAKTAVQGNLDPVVLLVDDAAVRRETRMVLEGLPMERHVFNLGHGIRQETDLRKLEIVIDEVRAWDGR